MGGEGGGGVNQDARAHVLSPNMDVGDRGKGSNPKRFRLEYVWMFVQMLFNFHSENPEFVFPQY